MHRTFSFPLLHCCSALDVYKCKCNTATNTRIIKIWVFRVDPIYCRYIDPAERVPINLWYIHKRVPSLILTAFNTVLSQNANVRHFLLLNVKILHFLSWDVKIRQFLSRKTGFLAVSLENGKFALRGDSTFHATLTWGLSQGRNSDRWGFYSVGLLLRGDDNCILVDIFLDWRNPKEFHEEDEENNVKNQMDG